MYQDLARSQRKTWALFLKALRAASDSRIALMKSATRALQVQKSLTVVTTVLKELECLSCFPIKSLSGSAILYLLIHNSVIIYI